MFAVNIVVKDFKYAHSSHMVWKEPYNWFPYYSTKPLNNFIIKITDNKKVFLPQIHLYVSERSNKNLLSNLPNSTKIWQKAKIIYENDKIIKNIMYRYRGDNPDNWSFEKKSIRLKFKKNEMRNKQRYFEYWPFNVATYLSTNLALNSEVHTSTVRLVELFLNDQSKGVFMELEKLDENFLRRNNFMPVNFYKGENYNAETKIGLDVNLYNNPGLWSKSAYFNKNDYFDKEDLKNFLIILKKSFNNKESFSLFNSYIDKDIWARYCAYLIVAQNHHHTSWHNARLILDPWNGKITPIITDPEINSYILKESDVSNLDYSLNDMIKLLNLSPEFIDRKYFYINNFLKDKNITKNVINDFNLKKKLFLGSADRDPTIKDYFNLKDSSKNNYLKDLSKIEKRLNLINNNLLKKINTRPEITWKKKDKQLSLNLNGEIPVSRLRFYFDNVIPDWILFDENYNGYIDLNEKKYIKKDQNYIDINVDLYANRLSYKNNKKFRDSNIKASLTKFDLIFHKNIFPNKIEYINKYSQKKYSIKEDEKEGSQTSLHNKVLHYDSINVNNPIRVFSGEVIIDKPLIITERVKILPGTIFKMKKNSSIIFKNKVIARGELNKKIKFINFNKSKKINIKDDTWGTIALLGKKTSGSVLNNIEFAGGSGASIKQYLFTSMLSIHDTSNISVQNSRFKDNYFYDDNLHIVYSKNIVLENLTFENSFGDALDIDISNNIKVLNSKFINSKNDAIDLMQTTSIIRNNLIKFSNDKGISVGEGSIAKIINNTIVSNKIGVAVKDGSEASIIGSKFKYNKNEISAYKKNWQYGSGGFVDIEDTSFDDKSIRFSSKNNSKIIISNSIFKGKKILTGDNIITNER